METKHDRSETIPCCIRCGCLEANYEAVVHCNSIFHKSNPCPHGPFCERCVQRKDAQTLPQCECRALISDWAPIKPGIGPPRLGAEAAGLYPPAAKPSSPASSTGSQPAVEILRPAREGATFGTQSMPNLNLAKAPFDMNAASHAVAKAAEAAAAKRAERAARLAAERAAESQVAPDAVARATDAAAAQQAERAARLAAERAAERQVLASTAETTPKNFPERGAERPSPTSSEKPGKEHSELLIRSSRGSVAKAPATPATYTPEPSPSPGAFATPLGFSTPTLHGIGVSPSPRIATEEASRSLAEALRSRGGRTPVRPKSARGRWLPFCQLWS